MVQEGSGKGRQMFHAAKKPKESSNTVAGIKPLYFTETLKKISDILQEKKNTNSYTVNTSFPKHAMSMTVMMRSKSL